MTKRWNATVQYLDEDQPIDVFDFSEITDLDHLIESGLCFYSIKEISIKPNGNPCGAPCECGAHKGAQS